MDGSKECPYCRIPLEKLFIPRKMPAVGTTPGESFDLQCSKCKVLFNQGTLAKAEENMASRRVAP